MPHILRFHDTDEGPSVLPDPTQVAHAAAWAGERGYWDVATCLMELAHALADAGTPRAGTCLAPGCDLPHGHTDTFDTRRTVNVPIYRGPVREDSARPADSDDSVPQPYCGAPFRSRDRPLWCERPEGHLGEHALQHTRPTL